jgi:uncharacterized protein YndB with AHSA1/START domain
MLLASPEEVFALLTTPSSIRIWWSAARAIVIPERGGIWVAAWGDLEDRPDYVTAATIAECDRPNRLVLSDYRYWAKSGPLPFDAEFTTEFIVSPHGNGVVLRVTQDGFPAGPEGDQFLAACETGWRETFAEIRAFLEAERE